MTIDASVPLDTVQINEIPGYIRAIHAVLVDSGIETTDQTLAPGTETITGSAIAIEVLRTTCTGAVSINTISGEVNGRIKIIIALDNNLTLIHNTGNLELKGDPSAGDLPMEAGDIIAFIYDSIQASYVELFRALI